MKLNEEQSEVEWKGEKRTARGERSGVKWKEEQSGEE